MSDDPIKDALRLMPYGFYAITSKGENEVNAMVANWLTQASFEPRLLALALQTSCYTYGLVDAQRVFAVNIFHQADRESMMHFTKGRNKKPDKMETATYTLTPELGCPILDGAAAYIECKVQQIVDTGGDHHVVIGEVVGGGILKPSTVNDTLTLPLLGWSYAG